MKHMKEERDQTVASMYLGIKVAIADVYAERVDDDLLATAFEAAQEAAKGVLKDHPQYLVEADC